MKPIMSNRRHPTGKIINKRYYKKEQMAYEEIIKKLKKESNPKNIAGMARFGINPKNKWIAKDALKELTNR